MPQVLGWALLSSGAGCEGWKAGAVYWAVLPAGEVDGVEETLPKWHLWGPFELGWAKAGRLSGHGEMVQECCWCSRAVPEPEKGCGGSCVLPTLCLRAQPGPHPSTPSSFSSQGAFGNAGLGRRAQLQPFLAWH